MEQLSRVRNSGVVLTSFLSQREEGVRDGCGSWNSEGAALCRLVERYSTRDGGLGTSAGGRDGSFIPGITIYLFL